jgi:hypothetical protein
LGFGLVWCGGGLLVVVLADEEGLITDRASSGAGKRGEDRRGGGLCFDCARRCRCCCYCLWLLLQVTARERGVVVDHAATELLLLLRSRSHPLQPRFPFAQPVPLLSRTFPKPTATTTTLTPPAAAAALQPCRLLINNIHAVACRRFVVVVSSSSLLLLPKCSLSPGFGVCECCQKSF